MFCPLQVRDYRINLDTSLPAPLDAVARWLLKTEGALTEEEAEPHDHGRAAEEAKEKQELLKVSGHQGLRGGRRVTVLMNTPSEGLSGGHASAPEDLPVLPEHRPVWEHDGAR